MPLSEYDRLPQTGHMRGLACSVKRGSGLLLSMLLESFFAIESRPLPCRSRRSLGAIRGESYFDTTCTFSARFPLGPIPSLYSTA